MRNGYFILSSLFKRNINVFKIVVSGKVSRNLSAMITSLKKIKKTEVILQSKNSCFKHKQNLKLTCLCQKLTKTSVKKYKSNRFKIPLSTHIAYTSRE